MQIKEDIKSRFNNSPFEWICFGLFLIYIAMCLTPSSYGLVLNIFGMNGEGLFWGQPRAIRSDEWAVWTPYFQAVVNNDFSRFNQLSLYHEDFRGFSALPIYDWALFFKPLLWPFLVLSDAYAFSAHHALIMLAFIIGWKQLIDRLMPETEQYFISSFFSLLLFFSGFVQGWWTTLGPVLALTPWLFIVALWCEKITPFKVLVFTYVSVAWLLSHTYPPIIISSAYLGILLVLCFKKRLINLRTVVGLGLGAVIALVIVYIYLSDAIQIMTQTVYPGKRISQGGAVPWELWLSIFVPYINHSNYSPLFNINICELGVVSSLLPMMAITFISYHSLNSNNIRVISYFIVVIILMSVWMLIPVPAVIAKITLLDHIPGSRLVWALGVALNILALYVLISSKVIFSYQRLAVFSLTLFGFYLASCIYYDLPVGKKSAWELIAIFMILIFIVATQKRYMKNSQKIFALLFTAFTINFIYFGAFNPGQSAKPIFELKDSTALFALKEKQKNHPKGWLVTDGYPGAVLQGLGLNSVTHVLMMPKVDFFKQLFPEMDAQSFNQIFNRYAHIHLTAEGRPSSPQADVIRVPKYVFGLNEEKSTKLTEIINFNAQDDGVGGFIDSIEINGSNLVIVGWGMISDDKASFFANFPEKISSTYEIVSRPDVVSALKDTRLINSGFVLRFEMPIDFSIEKLCLYTKDSIFGVKKLLPGNSDMRYKCVNK